MPDAAELRFERMAPAEIEHALAQAPLAYVPLGTLEWHGKHLPVGLDAMTAHGVCLDAARQSGGIVLPPLHYGVGGGHGSYPWTIMLEDADLFRALLTTTLARLSAFGVKRAILFSGHFAPLQLEIMEDVANRARDIEVRHGSVDRAGSEMMERDHAGAFETTLLHAFEPGLVRIDRLPPRESDDPVIEEPARRHVPSHPLYGIVGTDPRTWTPGNAQKLRDACARWLVALAS